ncbi:MAG: nucleotidyltransferase domain-containing protein, partial [Myxococcota bacterium]
MIKHEHVSDDVLDRIPDMARLLEADDRVVFAFLFGGLARGGKKPLSDVDLAVFLDGGGDLAGYKLDLFYRLTETLKTDELDLLILNTAPESIAGRALQSRVVLVDKNPAERHKYESLMLRKYFDFRFMED